MVELVPEANRNLNNSQGLKSLTRGFLRFWGEIFKLASQVLEDKSMPAQVFHSLGPVPTPESLKSSPLSRNDL